MANLFLYDTIGARKESRLFPRAFWLFKLFAFSCAIFQSFFHPSLSEFGVKYLLPLSCRYEQYVEDAYVAFLKQKGQAEQVRLESIMNNDELN